MRPSEKICKTLNYLQLKTFRFLFFSSWTYIFHGTSACTTGRSPNPVFAVMSCDFLKDVNKHVERPRLRLWGYNRRRASFSINSRVPCTSCKLPDTLPTRPTVCRFNSLSLRRGGGGYVCVCVSVCQSEPGTPFISPSPQRLPPANRPPSFLSTVLGFVGRRQQRKCVLGAPHVTHTAPASFPFFLSSV